MRLRKAREKLGFTPSEMAGVCGYKDVSSYIRLEAGLTGGHRVNQKIVKACMAMQERAEKCHFDPAQYSHLVLCPDDFPSDEEAA